jgi:hypothetical protein
MDFDFSSLLNNVESLAFIYAWTLFAAGVFALIERLAAAHAARKATAQSGAAGQ